MIFFPWVISFSMIFLDVHPCCSIYQWWWFSRCHDRLFATGWTVACQASLPTGVHCHFLFQVIFPTQRSKLSLLDCRWSLALQVDSLLTAFLLIAK